MLITFLPIFVADTKIIFSYNFVAPLIGFIMFYNNLTFHLIKITPQNRKYTFITIRGTFAHVNTKGMFNHFIYKFFMIMV